jgi:hypothetical protein
MSERKARVEPQFRNGSPVYIFAGANGEFAEFPTLEKLEAYLTAMGEVAVWGGNAEECPQSPVLVLP